MEKRVRNGTAGTGQPENRKRQQKQIHAWILHMNRMDMAPGKGRWEEATATPLRWSLLGGLGKKPCPGFLHSQLSEQEE